MRKKKKFVLPVISLSVEPYDLGYQHGRQATGKQAKKIFASIWRYGSIFLAQSVISL